MSLPSLRLTLRGSVVVEFGTGLALLAVPSVVLDVLVGPPSNSGTELVARMLGAALLALGVAGSMAGAPPQRGLTLAFVSYNVVATAILVVGGLSGSADGRLLWPAAALHAVVSAALITGALRAASARS